MSTTIFRAYDIRGRYPNDINEVVAYRVGLSFARMLGGDGRVLVGRDVRLSGPRLSEALAGGLEDGGLEVKDAGVVPTPVLYLGVVELGYNGGVQVTASHNPPEWNGFKLVMGDGETVSELKGMSRLREIYEETKASSPRRIKVDKADIVTHYVERVKGLVKPKRRVSILVDFSNGAGCVVGPRLLREIGCELTALNEEPNGRFPAHSPEPTPETLKELAEALRESGAEFGAGLDGDADRSVFLDDKGRFLEGDLSLAVFLHGLERRGRVVYDVSCSSVVEDIALRLGFEPVLSRTGRAFMLSKVREVSAIIGGEKSNHLYFSELHGFDDGIYAVAKMVELVSKLDRPLSDLVDSFPKYFASSIKAVEVPDEIKRKVVERAGQRLRPGATRLIEIDGVKAYLEDGWILIRPSNTMPQVKYTAESKTREGLEKLVQLAERTISEVLQKGA
ncbi:MAG: phosphomannomutase/phosphoglucomutase [Nitrososphaerota archaeon]|nr:phosphomannomutase/phosphoglucomutase [Candidatus Calditenuaceae archaeon]MDW8073038.1 phosphomannomutase/phosphoglucomutase [Nitrososphaerota archaeon]